MTSTELVALIDRYLRTSQAKRLCRKYHAEPLEARGELYLRLQARAKSLAISNPAAWINANGFGALQNFLRKEYVVRP